MSRTGKRAMELSMELTTGIEIANKGVEIRFGLGQQVRCQTAG
jgi:hypothetical protein